MVAFRIQLHLNVSLGIELTIHYSERRGVSNHRHLDCLLKRFFQMHIKEDTKALRHWPLWGESAGDRWSPLTKGQWQGKCFHLMTSSWIPHSLIHSGLVLKGGVQWHQTLSIFQFESVSAKSNSRLLCKDRFDCDHNSSTLMVESLMSYSGWLLLSGQHCFLVSNLLSRKHMLRKRVTTSKQNALAYTFVSKLKYCNTACAISVLQKQKQLKTSFSCLLKQSTMTIAITCMRTHQSSLAY